MAFDFKKEYRQFYRPGTKPVIVTIPKMNYLAVKGKGDPNPENSEYKKSISLLYGVAYTLKMSYKTDHAIDGFFSVCRTAARKVVVAGSCEEDRLQQKRRFSFYQL